MGRIAVKNGYAIERVGDLEIRRQVVAGSNVPDHYEVEDGLVGEETSSGLARGYKDGAKTERIVGNVDGGLDVKHQPDVKGELDSSADRRMGEHEPEMAAAANPLRARRTEDGDSISAKVAAKADKEQEKALARERDGSNIERLEERLDANAAEDTDEKPKRSRRRQSADKPAAESETPPSGEVPAEGGEPAPETGENPPSGE